MKDVVIVGGGLGGLSAAWRLRHWDIQLLESSDRVGGRVKSETRGQYVMNWGGHMYAATPGSATAALLGETGTRAMRIPGSLKGMAMNGKFISSGLLQLYPFRFPMSLSGRAAVLFKGAKVSLDLVRYTRAVKTRPGESGEVRQQRIYDFENDRSFAEYIGKLPPDAEAFFAPTLTRTTATLEQLSAGAGIGYFSLIWNIGQGLDRAIVGGPSTLTEGIAQTVRDDVELRAEVQEVVQNSDHVEVRYIQDGVERSVRARTAILATPAPITHRIAVNLPTELRGALAKIEYGPHVSGAFLTNETRPMPYDDCYAVAAAGKSFSVILNQGSMVRGLESERQPGGSVMPFSPGVLGRDLLDLDDDAVVDRYTRDIDSVFPGFANIIEEAEIARFPLGSPYCFPGRRRLQPILTKPTERVFLAGDYLGTLHTETAINSGFAAAQRASSVLATRHQRLRADPV